MIFGSELGNCVGGGVGEIGRRYFGWVVEEVGLGGGFMGLGEVSQGYMGVLWGWLVEGVKRGEGFVGLGKSR